MNYIPKEIMDSVDSVRRQFSPTEISKRSTQYVKEGQYHKALPYAIAEAQIDGESAGVVDVAYTMRIGICFHKVAENAAMNNSLNETIKQYLVLAIQIYSMVLEAGYNDWSVYNLRGSVYLLQSQINLDQDDLNMAENDFRKALELNPSDPSNEKNLQKVKEVQTLRTNAMRKPNIVSRKEIDQRDIKRIEMVVLDSVNAYQAGIRPLQTVHFATNGFDADPRALFEIAEMRAWCQSLYERIPFIFALLHEDTISWFLPCVAHINVRSHKASHTLYEFRPGAKEKLLEDIMNETEKIFNRLASTREEFDALVNDSFNRLRAALT